MPSIDLKYAFGLKPEKAIEYFKAKGFRITWDCHEMLESAHARAFTVAKVMRTDILQDIYGELTKALEQGQTFADWKKNLTPRLKAKGWWGEVVNEATGEIANVGPHRLRTIYETNIQTAYAVGQYQEDMKNTADRPWWMYVAVMDKRTRPAHAALNGLVFRYDDPFWDTHHFPNGFGCRCGKRCLTDARLEEKIKAGEAARRSTVGPNANATLSTVDKPLDREGKRMATVTSVKTRGLNGQEVAMAPDPGWNYNPGKAAPLWLERQRGEMRPSPGQKTYADFGRRPAKKVPLEERPVAPEKLPSIKEIGREAFLPLARIALGIADDKTWRMVKAEGKDQAVIHMAQLDHTLIKADGRERYLPYIVPTLESPFETWLTRYEGPEGREEFRKVHIGLFSNKQRREDIAVILREEHDGSIFWNVLEREKGKIDKLRAGELLYPAPTP